LESVFTSICTSVIRVYVGVNKNSITNCIFHLTKKRNPPGSGSYLERKPVFERNNVRNSDDKIPIIELVFDYISITFNKS